MKIANETKVGVLAVIALAGLILGFNFLKGSNLFQHSKKLYALFDNVDGMEVSNAVQIDGLTIGNISAIGETDPDLSRGILVTITLKKNVNIPRNSVATLNPGLLQSPTIVIAKGDATEYLQNGDTLQTRKKPNIISQIQQNLDPIIAKLDGTLTSLDSLRGHRRHVRPADQEQFHGHHCKHGRHHRRIAKTAQYPNRLS